MNNNNDENFSTTTDLVKQQNNKYSLSKYEADLFDEEKNTPNKIIRVKRVVSAGNENWKIFEDNKQVFLVEGSKLKKKNYKDILRSADGVLFLMNEYKKQSFSSMNALNKLLKERFDTLT